MRCSILVTNIVGKIEDKYTKKSVKELKNYNLKNSTSLCR